MKDYEYKSDMDTDVVSSTPSREFTWHIRDLKDYVVKRVSDLSIDKKADKVTLSRIYEALTGDSIGKDRSKGENFVIIKKI